MPAVPCHPCTRSTNKVEYGYPLGLASHHSGQRSSFTDVVRRIENGGPVNPRVAVRRVGSIQLIAAVDPSQPFEFLDSNINGKGEITRHPKNMAYAQGRESLHNVIDH